ncbi:hypothetical protein [Puia dinghuensis]|uniref:Uncharacterized protein n=1 Tax=Puia dinghuensis TaxID=1792502 RepID=A0A8J2XT58_9BACT|nr:hypothetical protein [Puia dinghuensis]GGB00691.1 hypothetical protein GCM10011511_24960 [Puia dinghuensis]
MTNPTIPYVVVGIDGTSSASWRKPDGSNSHVYQFVRDFQYGAMGVDKLFLDGPSQVIQGRDSEPILQKALDFVQRRLQALFPKQMADPAHPVHPLDMFDVNACTRTQYYSEQYGDEYGLMPQAQQTQARVPVQVNATMLAHQPLSTDQVRVVVVGHSRGGLIATVLAHMLSPAVRVYFLGLYDAVGREPCLDGATIDNVKIVFHARRNPDVGSRTIFGNTATMHRVEQYEESFFYTSHGGIGGDFVADASKVGTFGDDSCTARPDTIVVNRGKAGMATIDNRHPLTKRFGKPIEQICAEGRDNADAFIRNGARRFGLPI